MKNDVAQLALDRSARRIDVDGRLHVDNSHISKAAINPYYGKEIPRWEEMGLQPDRIYYLFRDPAELAAGAHTFARLPILKRHTSAPFTAVDAEKDLIIGSIGSNVRFNDPYLDADLAFWDADAIAAIDTGAIRELSCGYRYDADMTPGEYQGQPYDGRMTNIVGNHLALVEVGRAGPDVLVADHNPFTEVKGMKSTKLGKALMVALAALSPVLAADASLPALVGPASKKTFLRDDVRKRLLAIDADLDPQQLDNIFDAILDVEQDPKPMEMGAGDESPADKIRAMLAGKVEQEVIDAILAMLPAAPAADGYDDQDDDDKMSKADVTAAMDSLRAELREAHAAALDVRPVVGDVIGLDSAEAIYGFALDQMKIDRAGVTGAAALKALYKLAVQKKDQVAPAPMAVDGSILDKIPGANRFSVA